MREAPKQATDNAGAAAPGALWKRALRWFWAHPVQTVVLLVAVQTLPTLWSKDIWIVDESRHAAALVQMLEHGHWLMLHLGENLYPDKPPLYFWLAGLIALAAGTTDPWVMSAATAIGAALFAAATVQMTLTLGLGRRLALVAGLVIVTAQHFLIREHMPRMDLMYGALIVYAQLVFYAATKRPEGQRAGTYALAFFLSALAVLTKGPLAPLVCLAVLGSYLLCLGRVKELWRREFALGSLGLILPSAAYIGGVLLQEGMQALRLLLFDQSVSRAFVFPRNSQPVWFYLHKFPEALLPWSFLLFLGHWTRFRPSLLRHWAVAAPGKLYALLAVAVTFTILSSIGYKIDFLVFTALAPAAILLALALFALTPGRRRGYFLLIAALTPAGFYVVPFTIVPVPMTYIPSTPGGLAIYAAFLLPGVVLLLLYRRSVRIYLTAAAVTVTLASLPFYIWGFGRLDEKMSTRAIAEQLVGWQELGYEIYHYHPYELGWYDYHAGQVIPGAHRLDTLGPRLVKARCAALIALPDLWAAWPDKPGATQEVYHTRLFVRDLVIVLIDNRNPPAPGTPCTGD